MECPKCGLEIDDKAMVCPNCKKVLRLACPVCKTINSNNICKSCGYVIISKCHNCGKVNKTISKKCKKCGFETEKSVILNESNTDEFAMLTIQFPNLSDMKKLLGSAKLYNKFKINLDKIIYDYTKSIGLRRQIIDNTNVIRCNKDYTFNSSAMTAIKTAIELLNKITAMNCRLTKKKNATVRCNIFILKRSVEDDPYNIDSGYNISLLNQENTKKQDKILNTFQVLADENIADAISGEYKVSTLNSVLVDEEMVMISEVDIRNLVKFEYPTDEDDEIEVPNFVQNMLLEQDKLDGEALNSMNTFGKDPDSIYDIDTITFDEVKCEFIRTENSDAIFHIMNKLQTQPKGILAIKTPQMYKPYTLKVLNAVTQTEQYDNIISLTCYDEMKYTPYAFFRDLVSAIFEYTVSQKLFFQNDFSMFANLDPDGLIKDLITLQNRDKENSEDTRYKFYEIFLTLLQVIPKTLIYIEDFEKIDSSSYDILKFIFDNFEKLDIGILISYDKDFSLHQHCHSLLMKAYYTEITLKATTFEKLIEDNKVYYKNILNNFYFQRIAKYACGSSLFIDMALQYLIESGVYEADEETIEMVNPKTIIIPSSLDKLVARRINLLQDEPETMKFLTSIILLGTRIDYGTIDSLGYKNSKEIIEKLSDMGYVYEFNNCIYFPNYNLIRKNLLSVVSKIYLKEVAEELFEKVLDNSGMPSPVEAYLYSLLNESEKESKEWAELAEINLSLGDFSAYINCAERVLELVKDVPENFEYRAQIFDNIAENLYEYIPGQNSSIVDKTLIEIEKQQDTDKIIKLCNKIIDGALNAGDYNHALELMHKVLSLLPPSSVDPSALNFNKYFFLMSVIHVRILFNIGALKDCLEIGYKVLNVVNNETIDILKPDYFNEKDFKQLITDIIGYTALSNVLLLQGTTEEFLNIVRGTLDNIPQSYNLFIELEKLLRGIKPEKYEYEISENDKFGWVILNIINAFKTDNYSSFAQYMYKAKIAAKNNGLYQLELFADLLIAYAYLQANSYEKSEHIIYSIIKKAGTNGMTLLLYAAWYLMSELHLRQKKYDIAFGIINNSLIQIEKNSNTCEYLLMLFKYSMYKIMTIKQQYEQAQICLNHAQYIAKRYNIHIDFDTNINNYKDEDLQVDLSVNPILDTIYPEESEGEQ